MFGAPGVYTTAVEGRLCNVRDQDGLLKVRADRAVAWENLELEPTSFRRRGVGYWSAEHHRMINTDVSLAKYESLKLAVRNDDYGCGRFFTKYRWANKLIRAALVPPGDMAKAKEVNACLRKLWNKGKVRCFLAMLIYKGHLRPEGALELLRLLAACKGEFGDYLQTLRRPGDYTAPAIFVAHSFVGRLGRLLNQNHISDKMLNWAGLPSNSDGVALLQKGLEIVRQERTIVMAGAIVDVPPQVAALAEEALRSLAQAVGRFQDFAVRGGRERQPGGGAHGEVGGDLQEGLRRSFDDRGGAVRDQAAVARDRNLALRLDDRDYQLRLQKLRERSARILTARLADEKLKNLVAIDRALGAEGGKSLIQLIEEDDRPEIWGDLGAVVEALREVYLKWPAGSRKPVPCEVLGTALLSL